MSFSLDEFHRSTGTRFRLYVQSPVLEGFADPETVWVSSPAGSLGPGPSDARMYALQPIEKKPYGDETGPPFTGPVRTPAQPDRRGHFDHIATDDPAFPCAHMFGAVRRVLDVWETYLGGPVHWHFNITHPRLELVPHVPWDNAHFGWGFMECGEGADDAGRQRKFALNFDILAHETGHGLIFAIAGIPTPETLTTSYRGFHESASDCVALISALHFDRFLDHVLGVTDGNLYVENEMNRIGELSRTRQIRSASNALRLADVIDIDTPAHEATGKQIHRLGQPHTGAVFDLLAEFYLDRLVRNGVVKAERVAALREAGQREQLRESDRTLFADAFAREPQAFRAALCDARDMLGLRLAETWRRLTPHHFTFRREIETLLAVDAELTGTRHRQTILECYEWRGISLEGTGSGADGSSHVGCDRMH